MKKYYIEYRGNKYPYVELSYGKLFNDDTNLNYFVKVADVSLWDAIEEEYNNNDMVANDIDNDIFFYCDYGYIDNCTEEELIEYLLEFGC